jgi:hypothetical protein
MSPIKFEYTKFDLEIVSLEENCSRMPKKPFMEEENKNDREKYYINLMLEKSLAQQRDEMMDNFSRILQYMMVEIGAFSSRG